MRIESVTAVAFGPFEERTLCLAPGMTVVWGYNESGKSSWHAALYAGLCGLRRARGQPYKEDREFAEKHRPWEGDGWEVFLALLLDDGQRIDLRRDLKHGIGSARDADLGKDVSGEILNEGVPDGARWLGLDRRSFLAVACVRQADLLGVLEEPTLLQEHLQRAAATAATDATAAVAIDRIEGYLRDHVGEDNERSRRRPLRAARQALEAARSRLAEAREEHAEFLRLAAHAEDLAARGAASARQVRALEAALAAADAGAWTKRHERAAALAAEFPDGAPPAPLTDDTLAREATAALQSWRERPEVPALQGESAAALRAAIEALPLPPKGDQVSHQDVVVSRRELEVSAKLVEEHAADAPEEPELPATGGLAEEALLEIALAIEAPIPEDDPALRTEVDAARARLESLPGRRMRIALWVVGTILAAGEIACIVLDKFVPALLLLLVALLVLVWSVIVTTRARMRALEELHEAEKSLGEQRGAASAAAEARRRALHRAQVRGLPADPGALRELARSLAAGKRKREDHERWKTRGQDLAARRAAAAERLAGALTARGVEQGPDMSERLGLYEAACAERARIGAEAARRVALEAQLASREAAEAAAEAARSRRQEAEASLREIASRCGIGDGDAEAVARGLETWQRQRGAEMEERARRRSAWAELEALLDGREIGELATETSRRVATAERLAAAVPGENLTAVELGDDAVSVLERLRADADGAARAAAAARGEVEARSRQLRDVPESEEELTRSEEELARVLRLGETLNLARDFLVRAQERVHRDIARILADTIRPWLPRVTAGRYADIRLDPGSLEVQVLEVEGEWRRASLLSHGTAEQVYLLLRMALARHLSRPEETCPLVLDDITVQCDSRRKEGVLSLLHEISTERQVVLFTQEEEVLAWAEKSLGEPRDRVERLA